VFLDYPTGRSRRLGWPTHPTAGLRDLPGTLRVRAARRVLYNQGPPWWCIGCIHLGAEGFFIKNTILNIDPQGPTGLCMDVRDGATSDETVVQQWICRDSSARSMVWYTSQGDFPGALKVRNFNSDHCPDVRGRSSAEGAQLQQYHCTLCPSDF
jgi:Ricin-type beta-trefoil lectin domain-like